jgi:hypothetical protein
MATGVDGFGPVGEFTVEDLVRMPGDGLRYELLNGTLRVSPAPGALDLVDSCHVEVGCPSGKQEWQAQRPFPVTVRPADLSLACTSERSTAHGIVKVMLAW